MTDKNSIGNRFAEIWDWIVNHIDSHDELDDYSSHINRLETKIDNLEHLIDKYDWMFSQVEKNFTLSGAERDLLALQVKLLNIKVEKEKE